MKKDTPKEIIKYTTILHEQKKALGITCVEYCLLDAVDKLSRPKFRAHRKTVADWLGLSRYGVIKMINRLEEKGLIVRVNNKELAVTEKWHEYTSVNKVDSKEKEQQVSTKLTASVNKVDSKCQQSTQLTNNRNIIRNKDKDIPPTTGFEEPVVKPKQALFTSKDKKIAKKFFKAVKKEFPKSTCKYNEHDWPNTIRLLREKDKYTHDQIKAALNFGLNDSFWCKQIISVPMLRKRSKNNGLLKFENLFAAYEESLTPAENKNNYSNSANKELPSLPKEWKEDAKDNEDLNCFKIANYLQSKLKDKFKTKEKLHDLTYLVETLEYIYRPWQATPILNTKGTYLYIPFEQQFAIECMDHELYWVFATKIHFKTEYVGFEQIKQGSDCWDAFLKWYSSRTEEEIPHKCIHNDMKGAGYGPYTINDDIKVRKDFIELITKNRKKNPDDMYDWTYYNSHIFNKR